MRRHRELQREFHEDSHHRLRGPGGHGRHRARRGALTGGVLTLLAERPMHGYELITELEARSGGRWKPSPGAIYPTISQLEDEGLVHVEVDGGRKLASLTDAGRRYLEDPASAVTDPFAGFTASADTPDLRSALAEVHHAARSVAVSGTDEQIAAARDILADARRALYLLLAEGPAPKASDDA